jgi:hypothetical protein
MTQKQSDCMMAIWGEVWNYICISNAVHVYAWAQPKWLEELSSIHTPGILNQPEKHFKENELQLLQFMMCIRSPTISQSPLTLLVIIFPHATVIAVEASWNHYCIFHLSSYYIP